MPSLMDLYQKRFDTMGGGAHGNPMAIGSGQGAWNGGAGSWGQYDPTTFDLVQRGHAFGASSPEMQAALAHFGGDQNKFNEAYNYFNAGGGTGWMPMSAQDFGAAAPAPGNNNGGSVDQIGSIGVYGGTGPTPMGGGGAGSGAGSAGGGAGPLPGTGGGDPASGSGGANWPTFGQNDQYKFSPSGQYNDPSYQFRMDEGMRALMSQKAATGSLGSGQTLRDITNYGQQAASQEYGNAFNRFNVDRNFNYGVSKDDIERAMGQANRDREFDYTAQTGDRDYDLRRLGLEGQMGLSGAQGQTGLMQTLAALLSGNLNTLGQVSGTGTIAGGNNQNQMIQQILTMLMQNNAQGNQNDAMNNLSRALRGG